MGVHLFYESTSRSGRDSSRRDADEELTRYYYDDISDEVISRRFMIHHDCRPRFIGEHRQSADCVDDEVKERVNRLKGVPDGCDLRHLEARIVQTLMLLEVHLLDRALEAVSVIDKLAHDLRHVVMRNAASGQQQSASGRPSFLHGDFQPLMTAVLLLMCVPMTRGARRRDSRRM